MNIIINCHYTLLDTIKKLNLNYTDNLTNVDVTIPYTKEIENVNNKYDSDEEFVNYFGLDYDLVNCIELV